jgi:DNA modification methylase
MNVETWAIERVKPYEKNARIIPQRAIDKVAASIKAFGWRVPIVVDKHGVIVAGHTRLLAAKKLGLTEVPVHVALELTAAQIKAYRLADNRTAMETSFDDDLLKLELLDLKGLDLDLGLTGFDLPEIEKLLKPSDADDERANETPEVPEHPVSRMGDLWVLGNHRLLCGDSTNAADVTRLGARDAQMIITDPPYGMRLDTDWSGSLGSLGSLGRKRGTRGNRYDHVIGDHQDFDPAPIITAFQHIAEQFWFGADYYAERLPDKNKGSWMVWDKRKESQAEAIGSEFELLWSRQAHKRRMLRHDWFGFLSSQNSKEAQHRIHPTQKPTSLVRDVIQQWGKKAQIIYDPFLGSGTTLIAAEQTDRICFGLEIDAKYCDVIVQRWQKFTGKTAGLAEDGRTFEQVAQDRQEKANAA